VEETDPRSRPKDDDQRRRYYRLTPLGREVLKAETARLDALVKQARRKGSSPAARPWIARDDPRASHARACYAAALHLWPRALRERYGHDMRATFEVLSADAVARGPRACWRCSRRKHSMSRARRTTPNAHPSTGSG
jgi:hypothetical protein